MAAKATSARCVTATPTEYVAGVAEVLLAADKLLLAVVVKLVRF